jgi:hypothetical protein
MRCGFYLRSMFFYFWGHLKEFLPELSLKANFEALGSHPRIPTARWSAPCARFSCSNLSLFYYKISVTSLTLCEMPLIPVMTDQPHSFHTQHDQSIIWDRKFWCRLRAYSNDWLQLLFEVWHYIYPDYSVFIRFVFRCMRVKFLWVQGFHQRKIHLVLLSRRSKILNYRLLVVVFPGCWVSQHLPSVTCFQQTYIELNTNSTLLPLKHFLKLHGLNVLGSIRI